MQNYKLHLKGYVGGYDFDSDYVDYVLGKNSSGEVHVLIDSLGGSLSTALSIVAAFRNHGNVHVHYVGMNASAATIVSLGAAHVTIDSSAMYLVHKCSMEFFQWASANADKLRDIIHEAQQMKADLDKMDANIAEMYARKCKKKPCDLLALMKKGGWLTAQEALEWGFVDEVTEYAEDEAPLMTDSIAASMHANGIPVPSGMTTGQTPEVSALHRFMNMMAGLFRVSSAKTVADDASHNNSTKNSGNDMTENNNTPAAPHEAQPSANAATPQSEISALLAQKDTEIAALRTELSTLREEVEALKKAPGDTTSHVLDTKPNGNGEQQKALSDIDRYIQTQNSARALYDSIKS